MGKSMPAPPPPGLRAGQFEHEGRDYVVLSYPATAQAGREVGVVLGELTTAENEVVRLVVQGRSNAAIAEARGTAVSTVAKQLEQIYDKLGINSRRELAVIAGGRRATRRTRE